MEPAGLPEARGRRILSEEVRERETGANWRRRLVTLASATGDKLAEAQLADTLGQPLSRGWLDPLLLGGPGVEWAELGAISS